MVIFKFVELVQIVASGKGIRVYFNKSTNVSE